jgi:hypothetical protein
MSLEHVFPRDDISMHFLGNEAVLFDSRHQKMVVANEIAAAILGWAMDGTPEEGVVQRLADRFGLSDETAEEYVSDLIEQWRAQDRQNESSPPVLRRPAEIAAVAGCLRQRRGRFAETGTYRLLDTTFCIRYATKTLHRTCHRMLLPFAVMEPAEADAHFDLFSVGDHLVVIEGDRLIHQCEAKSQAVPMIKASLIERALEDGADFCALHAGAVRRGAHGILLPGESGSGKSVLTAALVSEGFELLSDDTVVLSRPSLAMRSLPFGICIKEDAWQPLAGRFPALRKLSVHDRPDGKRVRYLSVPERAVGVTAPPVSVSTVVFPRYDSEAATVLAPLDKNETLRRLMSGFQPMGPGLSAADVEHLLLWIENKSCYEFSISSLDDAVDLMNRVFA